MEFKELLNKFKEETLNEVANKILSLEEKIKIQEKSLKAAEEKAKAAEEKIITIEKFTANKFSINRISEKFKVGGVTYDLRSQGAKIMEKANNSSRRNSYNFFTKDDENMYNYKKFMLLLYKSLSYPNDLELREQFKQLKKDLIASEVLAKAPIIEGVDSQGGYGVPVEYEKEFLLLVREDSHALNLCDVINMSSDTLNITRETGSFIVYYPGEATAPPESSATQGRIQITAKKAMILSNGVSMEVIADSHFDLVGYIGESMAYELSQDVDDQWLNGTTAVWPVDVGLMTSAISNEVTITGSPDTAFSGITDEDLSLAVATISGKYAQKGQFIMNRIPWHYIRVLKDAQGQPIFVPASAPTVPSTAYGYPITIVDKAVNVSAANTAFISFGDMKQFLIVNRLAGMVLESDPYSKFDTDMMRYRMKRRHGMAVLQEGAFCKIKTNS